MVQLRLFAQTLISTVLLGRTKNSGAQQVILRILQERVLATSAPQVNSVCLAFRQSAQSASTVLDVLRNILIIS